MGYSYSSKLFGGTAVAGGSGPLTITGPLQATTVKAIAPATVTITNATNATPIVVTATAHGLVTGDFVTISGITGNTNANGFFKVTRLTADTFSLQNYSTGADIAGNGAYGGTPVAVTGIVYAPRVLVGDGTAAAPSIAFGSEQDLGAYRLGAGVAVLTKAIGIGYNGTGAARLDPSNGYYTLGSTALLRWTSGAEVNAADLILSRSAAATLQLGAANAASPVAQTLKVQDATGSNANGAASFTIKAPAGRGTGTRGKIVIQTPQVAASGDNGQTQADRLTIGEDYVDTNIGTGTAVARVGGVLNVNTTSRATTGTSEEVLATYTLPANTLSANGKAIRVTAWGTTAANGNNKTARIRFGGIAGTNIALGTFSTNDGGWEAVAVLVRTGASTQTSAGTVRSLTGGTTVGLATAQTMSNAIDIVVTGTTPTSAGDITFKCLLVEALN